MPSRAQGNMQRERVQDKEELDLGKAELLVGSRALKVDRPAEPQCMGSWVVWR
jgi:hypothetical protein